MSDCGCYGGHGNGNIQKSEVVMIDWKPVIYLFIVDHNVYSREYTINFRTTNNVLQNEV